LYKKSLIIIILALISNIFFYNIAFASIEDEKAAEETSLIKGNANIINIKSDELKYFQEKDQFVATGHVVVVVEDDGTIIKSDELIYDKANEEIISEKNVEIIKNGVVIYGDYAKFDIEKGSSIIGKPNASLTQININAQTANVYPENVDLLKGRATINEEDMMIVLSTGAVGQGRNKDPIKKIPGAKSRFNYDIKAKEIIVKEQEYRNIIVLKNADININKFRIVRMPVLTINTDQEVQRIETTLPEIGHYHELGSFFGYGHVFNTPKGSTLKALPIITFGSGVGVGGMGRFMSSTNKTELFYSSLKGKTLLLGEQKVFGPNTKIQYSSNAYIENGFFGQQKPKYLIELVDERNIAKAYNFNFGIRSGAGFVEQENNYSTGRFQLQGNMTNIKPLLSYKNYLNAGLESNFGIMAYGTGNTYGVARIGPTLAGKVGPFDYWTGYFQGGIGGSTPFEFDEYRYGKSNFVFRGSTKITDYVTAGYFTSLNLTKDNWEKDLVTENMLFVSVGPQDLKVKVGYDVERKRTVFGFDLMIGSESSALEFDKLKYIPKKDKK